jgi:hypothetical protein
MLIMSLRGEVGSREATVSEYCDGTESIVTPVGMKMSGAQKWIELRYA